MLRFLAQLCAQFERIGSALGPLLDLAGGHPQRTMLLAHWLWEETPPGGETDEQHWAKTYELVLRREVGDELRGLYFRRANKMGLYQAIRRHGGRALWAKKIGLDRE